MKILLTLVLTFALPVFGHEGHHGPEQKVAPHGGVIRDSATLMFELVKGLDHVKIYPLTHEAKSIEAKLVEIDKAKVTLTDSKKKPVSYQMTTEGDAIVIKFDKGSSHRYSLNFIGRYEGKENKATWQIEMSGE